MKYHVVLGHAFDLDKIARDAEAGKRPTHVMTDVVKALEAKVHVPDRERVSVSDKLQAKIVGRPDHWALARRLAPQLGRDDVVYCTGEDVGYPIAALCDPQNLPKIIVFIHNPDRPRGRLALTVLGMKHRIDLFMTNTILKAEFLQHYLQLPDDQLCLFREQHTDIRYFTPGAVIAQKRRPLVGSGGLESRDYHTLADAVRDLDLDVRVSAVSPDAKASTRSMPAVLPSNMICAHHDWHELRQLYRDSDVVVVSLQDHNYQAGLTTLFEAMACRRPVIMTRTPGLAEELIDAGYIIGVQPKDVAGMKAAIVDLLEHPQKAEALAQKGYDLVMQQHNHFKQVEAFVTLFTRRYGDWIDPKKLPRFVLSSS